MEITRGAHDADIVRHPIDHHRAGAGIADRNRHRIAYAGRTVVHLAQLCVDGRGDAARRDHTFQKGRGRVDAVVRSRAARSAATDAAQRQVRQIDLVGPQHVLAVVAGRTHRHRGRFTRQETIEAHRRSQRRCRCAAVVNLAGASGGDAGDGQLFGVDAHLVGGAGLGQVRQAVVAHLIRTKIGQTQAADIFVGGGHAGTAQAHATEGQPLAFGQVRQGSLLGAGRGQAVISLAHRHAQGPGCDGHRVVRGVVVGQAGQLVVAGQTGGVASSVGQGHRRHIFVGGQHIAVTEAGVGESQGFAVVQVAKANLV